MLQLNYRAFDLAFEYPFETAHGQKTHQPTLVVALGLGGVYGFGEAPAISYYNVTVDGMIKVLEENRAGIQQYALTDPRRFWHFLHHLLPGQHFVTAALDIAAWDLWAKLNRKPLRTLLGIPEGPQPMTDYTLGADAPELLIHKMREHPWPIYKLKMRRPDDLVLVETVRRHTDAGIRVDANEGWTYDDATKLLPELAKLGVELVEQPLARLAVLEMAELKARSPLPLFADESCQGVLDVAPCAQGFDGINIKLTKCGGITPALEMMDAARKSSLKVMLGSMNESTVGTAAIACLAPLADALDADGPVLLKEDIATGLNYTQGILAGSGGPGLGVKMTR